MVFPPVENSGFIKFQTNFKYLCKRSCEYQLRWLPGGRVLTECSIFEIWEGDNYGGGTGSYLHYYCYSLNRVIESLILYF